jgi:hypothetical protein
MKLTAVMIFLVATSSLAEAGSRSRTVTVSTSQTARQSDEPRLGSVVEKTVLVRPRLVGRVYVPVSAVAVSTTETTRTTRKTKCQCGCGRSSAKCQCGK